jgi:hypothetical protein
MKLLRARSCGRPLHRASLQRRGKWTVQNRLMRVGDEDVLMSIFGTWVRLWIW